MKLNRYEPEFIVAQWNRQTF